MLAKALALARQGFYVFPVKAGAKSPPLVKFSDEATRDDQQVINWWAKMRHANIGICTGIDLLVVDIDPRKGGNVDGFDLPPTYEVSTPTGGRHLYYRVSKPVKQGVDVLGPGVDIRSKGGYVVGPGSVRPEGVYAVDSYLPIADAPQWLIDKCGEFTERERVPDMKLADSELARRRAAEYLRTAAPAVQGAGGDLHTYKLACHLRDLGVVQAQCVDLLLDHWNERCSPPWDPDELADKVANAYRYANEPAGNASPEALFEDLTKQAPSPDPPPRFKLVTIDQITAPRTPRRYLVKSLFLRESINLGYGASNIGKSFVALDIGLHVAAGKPWMGKKVSQSPVLYVAAEAGEEILDRVNAWVDHHKADKALLPFAAVCTAPNLAGSREDVQGVIDAAGELAQRCGTAPGLIVIDTLAASFGGEDENATAAMNTFVNHVLAIRQCTGAAVLVIHHTGKDATRGARGSSSLFAGMDTVLKFESGRIWIDKQRSMRKLNEPIGFALQEVVRGEDEDGDPITNCVVGPANAVPLPVTLGTYPGDTLIGRGIESLKKALLQDGFDAPLALDLPPGWRVVSVEKWRVHWYAETNTPLTNRQNWKRTRDTLDKEGVVRFHDQGLAWFNPAVAASATQPQESNAWSGSRSSTSRT